MKILHVTPSFYPAYTYGGTTVSVYNLCRHLQETGCEVRTLTTDANGANAVLQVDTRREVRLGGSLPVRYCHRVLLDSVSPALLKMLPAYIRWADVVHVTAVYSFPTIPALSAAKLYNKPVVWSPRGMLKRWQGSTRRSLKYVWEQICRGVSPKNLVLHFTSEDEARESIERMSHFRAVVIPNGVQIPGKLTRNDQNNFHLTYLGRLHPIKGIENLLSACAILEDSKDTWSLTIAGTGEKAYTERLREQIRKSNLCQKVRMAGEIREEEKQRLFESASVVVVPSYTENFGMVVAEALAHAVPVLAGTGTPWQRIEEMNCGLWVDNHPQTLATAIRQIRHMPLREMGQRGREWMRREYSWASVASKMADVYRSLV